VVGLTLSGNIISVSIRRTERRSMLLSDQSAPIVTSLLIAEWTISWPISRFAIGI